MTVTFGNIDSSINGIDKVAFPSYPLSKRSVMAKVVKKSLSIDKTLAAKVDEIAAIEDKAFSQIVSEAVSWLLDRREASRMETAYKEYYSRPRRAERKIV